MRWQQIAISQTCHVTVWPIAIGQLRIAAEESLSVYQAVLDLAIPNQVIWFQGFYAYLAFVRCARLADPDDLESGAPAVPLQGNHLPHLGDALGRNQAHSDQGDLIGAAGLGICGFEISINFDWNGDVQPVLSASIGYRMRR